MRKNKIFYLTIFLLIYNFSSAKVALVLSGGGARGIAHIGVLKVIDELEIEIDLITGTSIGAVIGALYAQGYSGKEIERIILEKHYEDILDDSVLREDLYIGEKRWYPTTNITFQLDDNYLPSLPRSFITGNRLTNNFFDYYFPSKKLTSFDQLPIPFRAVSTNIVTGEKKVFDSGNLHEAVRASMSVPSIIAPFELDGELYVDGGVRANFPTEIAAELGADTIIGVRVNTGLRDKDKLDSMLKIYDQTVNISITDNVSKSEKLCDILITPDLSEITTRDFIRRDEIIKLGEEAAKEKMSQLQALPKRTDLLVYNLPEKVKFDKINVLGNEHLSSTKVKEFVGLKTNIAYKKKEIMDAFEVAYCSKLFDVLYPVIELKDQQNILTIKVKEANRKKLGIGITYDNHDKLVVSSTIEFNNVLQRNSKLLLNFKVGGKQEMNLDYVKNYGKFFGAYYRLFPYFREYETFTYNQDHEVEKSVLSSEGGMTTGLGVFSKDLVLELYGYALKSQHYRHIAEFEDTEIFTSGVGLKVYHESLDDLVFPTRGGMIFAKVSSDRKEVLSDLNNYEIYAKLLLAVPFNNVSMKYGFEYGKQSSDSASEFSPNNIGGIDSFMGLNPNEMNASVYQINRLSMSYEFPHEIFLELQYNVLNFGDVDELLSTGQTNIMHGFGLKAGLKTKFIPVRLGVGIDKDYKEYFYFSLGYQFDDFFFSRK